MPQTLSSRLQPNTGLPIVQVVCNVPFLEPGREETLDLYLPAAASKLRPAVVWIHGGGWSGGDKRDKREIEVGTFLAEDGFIVASINYKLGSDTQPATWPQPLLDCKNAVRFLRAYAEKYDVDTKRIAVMGGSAGGHLALMTAFTGDIAELEPSAPYPGISNRVAATGNFYGVTNLLTWRQTLDDGTPTDQPKNFDMKRLLAKTRDEDEALWRFTSPITHLKNGAPPVFNTHGKKDTTVDYLQAVELSQALEKAGVMHETVLLEDAGHTYALSTWGSRPLEKDLRPLVVDFLHRAFAIDS